MAPVKRLIVVWLERLCWCKLGLPFLCYPAIWSYNLDEKWNTGVWTGPDAD